MFYLLTYLLIDLAASYTANRGINNLPLVHAYAFFEFIFLSLFYRKLLKWPEVLSRNFDVFILIFAGLILANSLFVQSLFEYNSYGKTIENIGIITYSLLFIFNLIQDNIPGDHRQSYGILNSGILIYFMGTLVIYLMSDYFYRTNQPLLNDVWKITVYLNGVLMLMLLIGIFQAVRPINIKSKLR